MIYMTNSEPLIQSITLTFSQVVGTEGTIEETETVVIVRESA